MLLRNEKWLWRSLTRILAGKQIRRENKNVKDLEIFTKPRIVLSCSQNSINSTFSEDGVWLPYGWILIIKKQKQKTNKNTPTHAILSPYGMHLSLCNSLQQVPPTPHVPTPPPSVRLGERCNKCQYCCASSGLPFTFKAALRVKFRRTMSLAYNQVELVSSSLSLRTPFKVKEAIVKTENIACERKLRHAVQYFDFFFFFDFLKIYIYIHTSLSCQHSSKHFGHSTHCFRISTLSFITV